MNKPAPVQSRLARITSVSRIIATVCSIFMIVLPLGIGLYVFRFSALLLRHPQIAAMDLPAADLSALALFAAFAALLIGSAPMLWALLNLRRLFLSYAEGAVFTAEAASRLKAVAGALLAMVLVRPVTGMLLSLALSIDKAEGERQLVVSFGSNELWLGLAGAMVLVIAWIMGEAAALAEDNQAII